LAAAEDDLRAHGCADATLWVLERNAIARSFYERSGWAADGATKTLDIAGAALAEVRYRRGF
jgi:ribosomal protein S18 acetylase RimI-like enzyme